MNFIYSLALWGILFLIASITKTFTDPGTDSQLACFVFQIISVILFIIFFFVFVFYQMDWHRAVQRKVNKINRLEKEKEKNEKNCVIIIKNILLKNIHKWKEIFS